MLGKGVHSWKYPSALAPGLQEAGATVATETGSPRLPHWVFMRTDVSAMGPGVQNAVHCWPEDFVHSEYRLLLDASSTGVVVIWQLLSVADPADTFTQLVVLNPLSLLGDTCLHSSAVTNFSSLCPLLQLENCTIERGLPPWPCDASRILSRRSG